VLPALSPSGPDSRSPWRCGKNAEQARYAPSKTFPRRTVELTILLQSREHWQKGSAIASLGRAVAVAHESWNDETAGLLSQVVDIVDPVTGTVRQKRRVADADEMALDTRSGKTVRVKK
jgi:hypothetical protein